MKSFFISISMMLMAFMANAQQVVNVEFLDGDLDCDNQITINDVTGLIDTYLTNEEPRKTVSVTVDNSKLQEQIDGMNTALKGVIYDLEVRSENLEVKTTTLESKTANLENSAETLERKTAQLEDFSEQNRAMIWEDKADIQTLKTKTEYLEDRVKRLEAYVEVLLEEINKLKNGSE
ncbi:MAG: hypothetical protein IJ901_03330 [Bacteroidaceae bacterium]|nr:hypothetical protein [Bacteroidaceae bacterium]